MPALRSPEELADRSASAAMHAAGADGATCLMWGPPRHETSLGRWPKQARSWLSETSGAWEQGAGKQDVLRIRSNSVHCMALPLAGRSGVPGLLAVAGKHPLDDSQEAGLRLLAQGVGLSAENLFQSRHAMQRLDQLALIYDIGKAMNSTLDIRQLLDQIIHRGQEALRAEACSVLLVDDETQELYFEIAKGEVGAALERVRMKMDQGIAGWIATNGQPLIINDVSRDARFFQKVDKQSQFITRSILGVPMLARGKTIGVLEVLNKSHGEDFDDDDLGLLTALAADAAISLDNARLFQAVLEGYLDTIKALAAAVDAKDPYTAGHVDRVSTYSIETAELLGLSSDEMTALRYGAILHDVGKIGIADAILGKPAPLTREEFEIMSTHAEIGSRMLEGIRFLEKARPIARHHHETWNGSGYPDGLQAERIPRGARIVGAVDAFDAMTTDRPYRKALSIEFAMEELRKKAGVQFDTEVVEAFAQVLKRRGLLG